MIQNLSSEVNVIRLGNTVYIILFSYLTRETNILKLPDLVRSIRFSYDDFYTAMIRPSGQK